MNEVLTLLDELEDILDKGNGLPFTSKCLYDKEELLSIIRDIKLSLKLLLRIGSLNNSLSLFLLLIKPWITLPPPLLYNFIPSGISFFVLNCVKVLKFFIPQLYVKLTKESNWFWLRLYPFSLFILFTSFSQILKSSLKYSSAFWAEIVSPILTPFVCP